MPDVNVVKLSFHVPCCCLSPDKETLLKTQTTLVHSRACAPLLRDQPRPQCSSGLQTPRAFPVPTAIGLISCAGLPCAAINLAPIFATRRPTLVKSTHRKVQTTKPSMQSIPPVERTVEHGKQEASTRVRIFRCHPTSTSHASGPSLT